MEQLAIGKEHFSSPLTNKTTAERLRQCQAERQTAERTAGELSTELDQCRTQFAELRQSSQNVEDRAVAAEQEVSRLANVLACLQDEAELERFRALALQEQKWEAREQRLEQQLRRYVAQEERLEAQLLEGRRELHGASKQLVESLQVVKADTTPGARSQPPPPISGSEDMSPGDAETPHGQEDQGE